MIKWVQQWGFPLAAAAVMLAGVVFYLIDWMRPDPEGSLNVPLAEILPEAYPGWQVRELDLGPTEAVTERSGAILRQDDFVHREYKQNGHRFSVFVTYWKPGKMPVRLVNQHTPDRCWTEAGWICKEREWGVELAVGDMPLLPAQYGVYEIDESRQYTYFWHIVGGEVHWYGGERLNTHTPVRTILDDLLKFGLNVRREQFFIRVASREPMDYIWKEPLMQDVMTRLARLCLEAPEAPEKVTKK